MILIQKIMYSNIPNKNKRVYSDKSFESILKEKLYKNKVVMRNLSQENFKTHDFENIKGL